MHVCPGLPPRPVYVTCFKLSSRAQYKCPHAPHTWPLAMEHLLTNSQPGVSFCSSYSTRILLISFPDDVYTCKLRHFTVLEDGSHCALRDISHSQTPLALSRLRTDYAKCPKRYN